MSIPQSGFNSLCSFIQEFILWKFLTPPYEWISSKYWRAESGFYTYTVCTVQGYVLLSCRGWLKMSRSVFRGHYFLYFCKIDKENFVMEKCKVGGVFLSQISLYLIYIRSQRICPFSFSFDSFILLKYLHSISPFHFMVGATDYHHVNTTPFLWLVKIDYIHHISKFVFRNFLPNGFLFTFVLS